MNNLFDKKRKLNEKVETTFGQLVYTYPDESTRMYLYLETKYIDKNVVTVLSGLMTWSIINFMFNKNNPIRSTELGVSLKS